MPFITVQLIEGRTVEQKHALIKEISEAAIRVLDADPDNVRIVINEVTADDWGVAGVPVAVTRANAAKK
ncbi:MAG: 2-hydroxymuconate tautomerase family protein [Actinomycetes bacterium]|jgi:4-oxalocrotonate tautomerase